MRIQSIYTYLFQGPTHSVKAINEDETYKQYLILAEGVLPDKNRLLIASIEGTLHLFKLSIDFSSKHASITPTTKYSTEIRDSIMLIPLNAAIQNSTVILEFSNRAACTVRWDSAQLDRLSLDGEGFERIKLTGEPPRFSFNGAKLVTLAKDGGWLHLGGFTQKGMTGCEFNGEAWVLVNPFSMEPKWSKIEGIEMAKSTEDAELVFDSKTQTLFVINPKNGLFSTKINL